MKYKDITTNRKTVCKILGIPFDDIFFPVEHKIYKVPGFAIQDYTDEKVSRLLDELTRRNDLKTQCQECGVQIKSFNAFWDKNGDAICWGCKQREIDIFALTNLNNKDIEKLSEGNG